MKGRWYFILTVLILSQSTLVFSQDKSTKTGVVKNTSDEYNRQLEKCKVDAQVAPTPNSSPAKTTTNSGSQKAKSE